MSALLRVLMAERRETRATMPLARSAEKSSTEMPESYRALALADPEEREADRIADTVMRSADSPAPALPPVRPGGTRTGGGHPLDPTDRAYFERRFGADFSGVRLHSDTTAAADARELSANAFTIGSDISFASGRYTPGTQTGRRLLAHELAHVVQQATGGSARIQREPRRDEDDEDDEAPHDRSRRARPRNAPRGTVPIDQSGLDRETIHKIKDAIGAGPDTWVGITPDGHIVTTDAEGNIEDHGHVSDYTRQGAENVPKWVWALLGLAAVVALIVLFATGVGEVAVITAGLGWAATMAILAALRAAGYDSGSTASAESSSDSSAA
jgi:hypothetical protein